MTQRTHFPFAERLRSVGRHFALVVVGAVLGGGLACTISVVLLLSWETASQSGVDDAGFRERDPIGTWATGVVFAMLLLAATTAGAVAGGYRGARLARETDYSIATDRWPFRLLIVSHVALVWYVLVEGIGSAVRGPAPPDLDGGTIVGAVGLLLAALCAWRRLPRLARYFSVTGLLLLVLVWTGSRIDSHDRAAKLAQSLALLLVTGGAALWALWLLSKPLETTNHVQP